MSNYEVPTDELRQVKRPIKQGNGVAGPGYYATTTGYDTTVQRKWLIFEGVENDPSKFFMGSTDGTIINNVVGKPEWRDLPTIYTEKPVARFQ